ncbi:MAG: endopeptidase La [Chloroflexi bacterium]|nr:endopeptidase La [Chloroflexota bacterium]
MPLLPRRDAIVFPNVVAQLVVYRLPYQRAVEEAMAKDRAIVVVGRRNIQERDFTFSDLYAVGTVAVISRVLKMPDGSMSLLLQGVQRVSILELVQSEPYYRVRVSPLVEPSGKPPGLEALMRAVLALFERCVRLSPNLTDDAYIAAMNADEPGWLADLVAHYLQLPLPERQEILEILEPQARLERVHALLAREVEVLELQSKIQTQVQKEVEKSQREHILREQLRVIQRELSQVDPQLRELEELKEKVQAAGMSEAVQKKALDEVERLSHIPTASPENPVIRNYLDWLVNLPWREATEDNLDIAQAARVLDENHYGLKKVKERILEYIAVRKLAGSGHRSPILCFVGPPGVGKTSLGMSIAKALGRRFVRVSLGGIRDEAEIRGHRRTYVGALPGRIIQTMRQAGMVNPVFMLDELDKVGADFRGDPSAALLEVLDLEHNHSFSDHYLEVPFNLSRVLFIGTANVLDTVIPALRDRLEVIELPGYTEEEKLQIARQFLIPKQLQENGLAEHPLSFAPSAVRRVIREYSREAGVRNLERELGGICRKVAKGVAQAQGDHARANGVHRITGRAVPKYLGPPRFTWGIAEKQDEVGVATGVARTETGGDILQVEVTLMEGKGNLTLTGSLGEVMKESAQAAVSYARSRSKELGLDGKSFEHTDIHIHVPAGAVPKDGPSAGVTIATALVSALTARPARRAVAMTGEITLRGKVLPVGGIKEKVLAAHRGGITTFIMPKENEKDLLDIPPKVRRTLEFILAGSMDRVLSAALLSKEESR